MTANVTRKTLGLQAASRVKVQRKRTIGNAVGFGISYAIGSLIGRSQIDRRARQERRGDPGGARSAGLRKAKEGRLYEPGEVPGLSERHVQAPRAGHLAARLVRVFF